MIVYPADCVGVAYSILSLDATIKDTDLSVSRITAFLAVANSSQG